ncbi:MAG: aminopeptidase P N-terminal domain-containing protein [Acidobacteria bacterium]|nr:aminopeptidase P N-terminal domain-containing protein [Acidobacteriota bacterium]
MSLIALTLGGGARERAPIPKRVVHPSPSITEDLSVRTVGHKFLADFGYGDATRVERKVVEVRNGVAQTSPSIPIATFRARRDRAMQAAADAIILIRSRSSVWALNEVAFRQDPTFYYLTGLTNAVGALLVLDARRHESWLFVPEPGQLGSVLHAPYGYVESGSASADRLGLDYIASWSDFASFVDRRLAEDPTLVIRGPFRNDPVNATPARLIGGDQAGLWESALRVRWPQARFGPAPDANALRTLKDSTEIAVLRRVAASSSAAFRAGLAALRPGRRQRAAEVDVVAACVGAGAERVSYWPWIMTGSNSDNAVTLQVFADSRFLDRVMRAGELAHVDTGCAQENYEGGVGRMAPVSGRFDAGQREAWDLFVAAYRTALKMVKPGRTSKDVFAAWQAEFERQRPHLKTAFGKRTAEVALSAEAAKFWVMHGIGVSVVEGLIDTIQVGQVLALEPILTVDGVGLYLEDMILVTPEGAEVLTTGLPYTAAEIEAVMRARR